MKYTQISTINGVFGQYILKLLSKCKEGLRRTNLEKYSTTFVQEILTKSTQVFTTIQRGFLKKDHNFLTNFFKSQEFLGVPWKHFLKKLTIFTQKVHDVLQYLRTIQKIVFIISLKKLRFLQRKSIKNFQIYKFLGQKVINIFS